jgi:hypothetical protein
VTGVGQNKPPHSALACLLPQMRSDDIYLAGDRLPSAGVSALAGCGHGALRAKRHRVLRRSVRAGAIPFPYNLDRARLPGSEREASRCDDGSSLPD